MVLQTYDPLKMKDLCIGSPKLSKIFGEPWRSLWILVKIFEDQDLWVSWYKNLDNILKKILKDPRE